MSENKIDCVIQYLKDDDFRYHMEDATPYKELSVEERDILSTYITQLQQENQQLKDNWDKIKDIIEDERMSHWQPSPLFLTELLSKMQELEKGKSE